MTDDAALRCPTCRSPRPELHPATAAGGEVIGICADPYHAITPEYVARLAAQGLEVGPDRIIRRRHDDAHGREPAATKVTGAPGPLAGEMASDVFGRGGSGGVGSAVHPDSAKVREVRGRVSPAAWLGGSAVPGESTEGAALLACLEPADVEAAWRRVREVARGEADRLDRLARGAFALYEVCLAVAVERGGVDEAARMVPARLRGLR